MSQSYSSLSQESNLLDDEHLPFVFHEVDPDLINQIANDPTTFHISNSQNTYSSLSSKSQSQSKKKRATGAISASASQKTIQSTGELQAAKPAKSMRTLKIEDCDLTEATAASTVVDKVRAATANAIMAATPINSNESDVNSIARMAQIGYQNMIEESHEHQRRLKMKKQRCYQSHPYNSQQQQQQPQLQHQANPHKTQPKQPQRFQPIQLSPTANEIKHHPTSATYEGPYDFSFRINEKCPKNYWLYSKMLNKVFIQVGKTLSVQFRWTPPIQKSNSENLYVRAMMVYSQAQDANDIVARCIPHAQPTDALNVGCPEHTHSHLIRCTSGNSTYHGNAKSKEHLSVLTALGLPQKGVDFVELFYLFTCKNSCSFGINRKPTKIIFTLENQQGTVCGRCSLNVRICSVPKRDLEKDENDFNHVQYQQRQNAAAVDQNSSGLANGASFNVSSSNFIGNGVANVYHNGSGDSSRFSRLSASYSGYGQCDSSSVEVTPTMPSLKRYRTLSPSSTPKLSSSSQSNAPSFEFDSKDVIQMPSIQIADREKLIKCLEYMRDIHCGAIVCGTKSREIHEDIVRKINQHLNKYLNEYKPRR